MTVFITLVMVLVTLTFVFYPFFRGKPDSANPAGVRLSSRRRAEIDEEIEDQVLRMRRERQRVCPKCGARNQANARFCSQCAVSLSKEKGVCPKCGARNQRDARFCSQCAVSLSKEKGDG